MEISLREYPGRIVLIGKDPADRSVVIGYAVTGRSPSSQARRIVFEDDTAWVRPSDEDILRQGRVELLIYPAIRIGRGIAVSNGRQTDDVFAGLGQDGPNTSPSEILAASLKAWDFEPDAPNFTPRISGCLITPDRAALSIIKRDPEGRAQHHYFEYPLIPGKARLIATYSGENRSPLPSFSGEPLEIGLETGAAETASALYAALAPEDPKADFRVAAACLFASGPDFRNYQFEVVNRHDLNGKDDT